MYASAAEMVDSGGATALHWAHSHSLHARSAVQSQTLDDYAVARKAIFEPFVLEELCVVHWTIVYASTTFIPLLKVHTSLSSATPLYQSF